jgi:hypothetical protein
MNEINPVARRHGSLASLIGQRPSLSNPIEPPRDAHASPDKVAMGWLRLRTMVDGLLRRAAAKDAAGAIAATSTTSPSQEANHA